MDDLLFSPTLVFCIIQVVAAMMLAFTFYLRRCWRGCIQPTMGTVVGMCVDIQIQYRIADGTVLTRQHKVVKIFSKYYVGMQVPLLYNAAKPTRFVEAETGNPYKSFFYMSLVLTISISLMGFIILFSCVTMMPLVFNV